MSEEVSPGWIAADWGTTHLRVFAMEEARVLAQASSPKGMASLARGEFEGALLELIADWLPVGRKTLVIACGMVGSRQGWVEAPYATVPCPPLQASAMVEAPVADPRLSVWIIPGLSQTTPADVMRGEETQIAGFLAGNPGFSGTLCLPGTHSKWVRIERGTVTSFSTFMTGELFALLSKSSVLRHGMADDGWDTEAFAGGVTASLARPDMLAAAFFSLRAEGLLHGLAAASARARLSGLIIGAEIAAVRQDVSGDVTLIGAPALSAHYLAALKLAGLDARATAGESLTLAGLGLARRVLTENQKG
ncbi:MULTISPECIES: 2-dehydro-3-deoxygalactonokinase [Pannonibacter]|uniref:2-dehydro-3-deoxygalactonokinase n=1 Tax=Pannonibacter TaxID=227873 RepID=UPI000F028E71|nr:2-dehydro-3-deoxygalactonokinase [Pannonibacter phragmitetus]